MRLAVQTKRLADGVWITLKKTDPQLVAEDRDGLGLAVRADVGRLNRAARYRRHAKKVERVARQPHPEEALRRELSRHQHGLTARRHHVAEGWHLGHLDEFLEGMTVAAAAVQGTRLRCPDFVRPRVRIGGDEHAVDHAEDGRRRTDPEGQREECDENERRAASKRPHGIDEILSQGFEPARHAHLSLPANRLLDGW